MKPKPNTWISIKQWSYHTFAADRQLLISVVGDKENGYLVLAIETARGADIEQVLDAHAHQRIGKSYLKPETAKKAAERYARKWTREREAGVQSKNCECGTIPSGTIPSPSGSIVN